MVHSFSGSGGDGKYPSGVSVDSSGNLYLTTSQGGVYGFGAAFEFVKSGSAYREKILFSFDDTGNNGTYPTGGLVVTPSGKLYGTTSQGGGFSEEGTFFGLAFEKNGTSKANFLFAFGRYSGDAIQPNGLVFDSPNFYGATTGGVEGDGAIFELQPATGGAWTESVIHSFETTVDGNSPSGITFDASGNLYGTTCCGDTYNGGTVFELTPSGGVWTETVLYVFTGGADGNQPNGGVTLDGKGNLYGTTHVGGTYSGGTVFEVTP